MNIPRSEHPKPQFMRDDWLCLNGQWAFCIDNSESGESRGLQAPDAVLDGCITVPFCPESPLSGVGHLDFMRCVWYQRHVSVTPQQLAGRVVLHCGAVDYECTVFVNGEAAGTHKGGYASFQMDITSLLHAGDNVLTLRARDDTRSPLVPSGKQSTHYESYSCLYRRSTGIWQSVWLEYTPCAYIKSVRFNAHTHTDSVGVALELAGCEDLKIAVSFAGKPMAEYVQAQAHGHFDVQLPLAVTHLWDVGQGNLYDVTLTFGQDVVHSYFGLRQIEFDHMKWRLNGRSVFQRLILDQGYYPDGIYTAPSDAELEADVLRGQAMGFNGARLHQKVFEERFLYYCDKHGYLVWGEYPSWGIDMGTPLALHIIMSEWADVMERDINHPSIIGWCPLNETNKNQRRETVSLLYRFTKAMDPSRPCIDTSGYVHVQTDIFDVHDYDQTPETFRERYKAFAEKGEFNQPEFTKPLQNYGGQPVFISEYGGIRWSNDANGWGYGEGPQTEDAFFERFQALTDAQLDHPKFFGFCYTQLTDVEQEQNGLYTFDRQPKFDPAKVHAIVARKAAIED